MKISTLPTQTLSLRGFDILDSLDNENIDPCDYILYENIYNFISSIKPT